MSHTCHHPGCSKEVSPRLWGCKPHWYRLPLRLRVLILNHYRPGQEIDKQPSPAYLKVAGEVQQWCLDNPENAPQPTAGEAHFRSVLAAAGTAIVKECGLTPEAAVAVLAAIADDKIPYIKLGVQA